MYKSVFVFYYYITKYHLFSNLKHHSFIILQVYGPKVQQSVPVFSAQGLTGIGQGFSFHLGSGSYSKLTDCWQNSSQASHMASFILEQATVYWVTNALNSSGFLYDFLFGF